jgi:hypothetical protein
MSMNSNPEIRKIEIGPETLKNLNITGKWTMFLAVSGFIFIGLIITLGLLTGTFLSAFSQSDKTPGISDIMLLACFSAVVVIYFFPVFFLFRFSKHTSNAITALNSQELNKGIRYLKLYFVYIGILLIITIAVYLAGLIITGTSPAFLKGLW